MEKKLQPVSLDIYNQNYEAKKVDIFSDTKENHTGIIDVYNNKNELKGQVIGLVRIQMPTFKQFMFNGFWLNGKKYMYSLWISPYLQQEGVVDCPFILEVNENVKFKPEIPAKSSGLFTFYPIEKGAKYDAENKLSLPKYQLCVIATNKTGLFKTVNILDKNNFPNGFEDKDSKIEIATCYINNDKQMDAKIVRGISLQTEQITQDVKLNNGATLVSKIHLSANQRQPIIDIPFQQVVKIGDTFEINLLPYSKVMYYFL